MISKEINEKVGKVAWDLHQKVIGNEKLRRQLLIDSMEAIHRLHDEKLYKVILGDENAFWSAYLTQHDTFYSASQIYMFDKIYAKFIKELHLEPSEIADIPNSKLSLLISFVNQSNVDDWLTKARELTSQDFNDEIRKAQGKVSYLECPHKREQTYAICNSCGFRHKI